MAGDTTAIPTGAVEGLRELAVEQGSLTPDGSAGVLDTVELPVEAEGDRSVGIE